MGFKAMNLARGRGVRYQVHLYRIETGELLAIMDAQHLTTLRTGATSAVAMRRLAPMRKMQAALIGSGAEARAQLEAMSVAGFVSSVRIFSPTPANRQRLAAEFRDRHGLDAHDVPSAEEAVNGAELVVAAVKSNEPVLFGRWLEPGVNVVSVGTARRDQREIDEETFRRSTRIVVDTRAGVFGEAGDAIVAKDAIAGKPVNELAEIVAGKACGRSAADEITLFKSVGTGIQDIALAAMIYERAAGRGMGTRLPDFPYLKKS
jgi:ornithine cyclodeaminase/alanine dehydrogenase